MAKKVKFLNKLIIIILICVLSLNIIALLNLWSISKNYFYLRLNHLFISTIAMLFTGWFVNIRYIQKNVLIILFLTIITLIMVLLFGKSSGGSQRWLEVYNIRWQPSEIAKITVILTLANFFSKNPSLKPYKIIKLIPLGLVLSIIFILIFLQPDLGTAGAILLIVIGQLYFININKKDLIIVFSLFLFTSYFGWEMLLHDYQKQRILTLLNQNADPLGSGYSTLQSVTAIGNGGFLGRGFSNGTQTQLKFLPARHSDFIFSVYAEEHGFIGGILLFVLFFALALSIMQIAYKSADSFSSLSAIGIGFFIVINFCVNVFMVLGLFPVVGIPMPFLSFGGSFLLTTHIAVGIAISIEIDRIKKLNQLV